MKKVISSKNLPTKLPIYPTIIFSLALDYWNAPKWVWGAIGFLLLIIWIGAITLIVKEKQIDIFKTNSKEEKNINSKSDFHKKLLKKIKENEKDF